jgi:8-oxo-dGTP diphosphatase
MMTYPIRVRPTALILNEGKVLLIEYYENDQYHYNLPGGGVESGETIIDTLRRELLEEADAAIHVGPIAFIYEYSPHKQSGQYDSSIPGLNIIFDCSLQEGSVPQLPEHPDPHQVGVKWVPLEDLKAVVLYPNIGSHITEYARNKRHIELIEDHQLQCYAK